MRRWLVIFIATAVVSLAAGWLLPDGLNELAKTLHQPKVPEDPLTKFLSALTVFLIAMSIDVLTWLRGQSLETTETIARAVEAGSARAAEQAVIRAVVPGAASTHDDVAAQATLIAEFATTLARVPPGLLRGYAVLMETALAQIADDLRAVSSPGKGIKADVQQHLEITRRLTRNGHSFVQVNRRAFRVPDEWTQEWIDLVDELGHRDGMTKEYIVLMPAAELEVAAVEIDGMRTYLRRRDWLLRCCEVERVRDALRGAIPTEANIDVYDGRFAKLQSPPPGGRYRGGIELDLGLVDLKSYAELNRFVTTIQRFAMAPAPRRTPRR